MPLIQVEAPFIDSLDFGIGVDSTNASPMGKVVDGEITGVTGASGAKVGFEIERIITTHDLETKLGIDAKASYAAGAFANIAGRFEFAAASKIHTTSLCMAITSTVALAVHSINNPVLSAAAASSVDNPPVFVSRFGDMFVRGIGRGGIFIAVLTIDTSDDQESEDISSQLSGAYGLFSGDAKQKFESIQRDFHSELSISVYHEGGPVNLILGKIDDPLQLDVDRRHASDVYFEGLVEMWPYVALLPGLTGQCSISKQKAEGRSQKSVGTAAVKAFGPTDLWRCV